MTELTTRRFLAFIVDYFLIVFYAALLYLLTSLFLTQDLNSYIEDNPFLNQLITFLTLTLPVFMYFYLFECSKWNATIGKRIFGIRVISNQPLQKRKIFMRNFLKFFPWEIAHSGVIWTMYFTNNTSDIPIWVWILLIFPQAVELSYLISVIFYKGTSSIYDKIANTAISRKIN